MKVLYSWLKDFVDMPDGPAEVGRRLSLRGLALESLEPVGAGEMPPGVAPVADDAVLDFDVTANRPDCLSVLGIAREIATVYGLPLRVPGPDAPGHLRATPLTPIELSGPVRGNALFFSYDRAHPSTKTLHGGAPVTAGEKWVATKWMRERVFV